jgi:hypothetical protein
LDFLQAGTYDATIYREHPDAANNLNALVKGVKTLTASDKLVINLPAASGEVIRLALRNN